MKILFASSEVFPFSKTGGLGDVCGALPKALAARGHEVVVVTPLYADVDVEKHGIVRTPHFIHRAHLWEKQLGDRHRVFFLDNDRLFRGRFGVYGDPHGEFGDNAERFGFLSRSLVQVCDAIGFGMPDVFHLHDWPTGPAALYLARLRGERRGVFRTVFTIHNLAYQGRFGKSVIEEQGLGWDSFTPQGLELHDTVSYLKAGLAFSDAITTVSPTYADEIRTPEHGVGLDGFLRARSDRFFGLVNGIDPEEWNPSTDRKLPAHYSVDDLRGKHECRAKLLEELGLRAGPETLVLGVVSRLVQQKGIDLILGALQELMHRDVVLAVLGSGEDRFEDGFAHAARHFPGRVAARLKYDDALAHRIEAGADAFLMPSRYEPCGLNQLYSLRYGTIPIVHRTGGLADTVLDVGDPSGRGTGFCMSEPTVHSLLHAVDRASGAFRDRGAWREFQRRGMSLDLSWDRSAAMYEQLYAWLHERG